MKPELFGVVLKQFEKPDEVRTFEKGRIEVVRIGPRVVGRATYEPGWKYVSLHLMGAEDYAR